MTKLSIPEDMLVEKVTVGNQKYNRSMDQNLISIMEQVLTTLKKIEFHLSILTETDLTNEEF